MWRKLFKVFGARVVVTRDFDGDIRYRFVRKTPFGDVCSGICGGDIKLNADGTCNTPSDIYVKEWIEV